MENYLYESEAIQMGTMRFKNSSGIVLSEAQAAAAAAIATVTAPSLLSY